MSIKTEIEWFTCDEKIPEGNKKILVVYHKLNENFDGFIHMVPFLKIDGDCMRYHLTGIDKPYGIVSLKFIKCWSYLPEIEQWISK